MNTLNNKRTVREIKDRHQTPELCTYSTEPMWNTTQCKPTQLGNHAADIAMLAGDVLLQPFREESASQVERPQCHNGTA
jgi:hypothetical protein